MSGKKKKIAVVTGIIILVDILLAFMIRSSYYESFGFQFNIESDSENNIQIFTGEEISDFNEEASYKYLIEKADSPIMPKLTLSTATHYVRIDFDDVNKTVSKLTDVDIFKGENHQNAMEHLENRITLHNVDMEVSENLFHVTTTGEDPYILIELDSVFISNIIENTTTMLIITIAGVMLVADIMLILLFKMIRKSEFVKGIVVNRKLIWNLSKNDFKTKYAGSFFGVLWAFVQPIVTVLLYWFVFQVGLRSGDVGDVPFVLWLMCGLVPWFFFQDALMAITNSMIEYSYLVKKMVFQIDILPIVKIVSALFVHIFFIAFTIVVFCLMGYIPTISSIQLIYYLFCSIVFVLGLGYATCALVLFFKDLSQIIQIFLQIGMWMTPILWNIEMLPSQFLWIMELNPMYYIVTGFRDSLITHTWVWNRLDLTLNFWLITITLFALGTYIYKKLKCHFADVL